MTETTATIATSPGPGTPKQRGRRSVTLTMGTVVISGWVLVALTVPWWAPFDPVKDQDLHHRLNGPSGAHWFGTDKLGRDVFTRVMYGARISLPLAISSVMLAVLIGCAIGAAAGFFGKWVDEVLMRITDVTLSFPAMVLALAIAAALGPGIRNVVIAVVLVTWPEYARLMRGQVLSIKGGDHVKAATAIGCRPGRVFRRHVLPFCSAVIGVKATTDLGVVILLAAGLSFIGVGAVPPDPEWGALVSDGRTSIAHWWIATFPGLAILTVVLAFNFIGDGLRDRYDPYHRRRRPRKWR
jgi:peptide/nickel transport system permease protein